MQVGLAADCIKPPFKQDFVEDVGILLHTVV